jgi:hypothetical protein
MRLRISGNAVLLGHHVNVDGDDEYKTTDDKLPEGGATIADLCQDYVILDAISRTEPSAPNIQCYEELHTRYLAFERGLRPVHAAIKPKTS